MPSVPLSVPLKLKVAPASTVPLNTSSPFFCTTRMFADVVPLYCNSSIVTLPLHSLQVGGGGVGVDPQSCTGGAFSPVLLGLECSAVTRGAPNPAEPKADRFTVTSYQVSQSQAGTAEPV